MEVVLTIGSVIKDNSLMHVHRGANIAKEDASIVWVTQETALPALTALLSTNRIRLVHQYALRENSGKML
jgi:hypothetical protein